MWQIINLILGHRSKEKNAKFQLCIPKLYMVSKPWNVNSFMPTFD